LEFYWNGKVISISRTVSSPKSAHKIIDNTQLLSEFSDLCFLLFLNRSAKLAFFKGNS
jgi:hypothetical protein